MSTTETDKPGLTVVAPPAENDQQVLTPGDMVEAQGVKVYRCTVEGCTHEPFKTPQALGAHRRNTHGIKGPGKPKAKKESSLSAREEFNQNIGKMIFPEGLPIYGNLKIMEGMVSQYTVICDDAWKLREAVKAL